MDPALGRVTVIGTNGMTMTSGVRGFLPPGAMTVLSEGSVVLNAFSMTDTAAPFPFVRFQVGRGTTVRFGDAIAGFDPHRRGFLRSVLTPSSDGGFWAIEVFGGTLRKYGPDLKRQFIRQTPAWFPKGQVNESPSIGQDGRPPTTFARAAAEDSEGRLWIVTSVPSRNWRQFASESTRGIERGRQPKEVSRLYESMIEVVDAKTGEVIYSTVAPMMIVHALGGGKFLAYSDNDEIPSIAVVRVQFAVRDGAHSNP